MLAIGIINTDSAFVLNRSGLWFMYFAALIAVKLNSGKPRFIMLVYTYCFLRRLAPQIKLMVN